MAERPHDAAFRLRFTRAQRPERVAGPCREIDQDVPGAEGDDEAVGRDPNVARNLHMGDYVNLSIDLQIDLNNLRLPDLACIPINLLPDSPLDDLVDLKNLCNGVTET